MSGLLLLGIVTCGLIGGGLYFLLTSDVKASRRRLIGWTLLACSFLPATESLLLLPGSLLPILGFCLSTFAIISTAVMTITSRHPSRAVFWFCLLVIASSAMFAARGVMLPAVGNVIITLGSVGLVLFLISVSAAGEKTQSPRQMVGLACLAGMVLLSTLVMAVRSSSFIDFSANSKGEASDVSIAAIGGSLLASHSVSLVLSSVLLLVSVLGFTLITRIGDQVQDVSSHSI